MRKLLSTALVLGVLSSTSLTPAVLADVAVNTLPTLDTSTNANVTTSGSNMNIKINGGQGGVGTLIWDTYNVGKDAKVNYEFTQHNQTALNKVNAAGGMSQIYGQITSSGCSGCGYDATGKVILINPNGVLFGDGANVNLNSFTVSTMDGNFNKDTNTLELTKGSNPSAAISVLGGANIYGAKNVTFASNNISTYAGSKISTSVAPNVGADSYGKVKLVTADGVNFTYYNNGAVKELSNLAPSTDQMFITLNGTIESGNIDARNYSVHTNSEINLKGATLKATKAVSGNDGNIWLTAVNKVVTEDSKLETVNYSADAATKLGGNVKILANNKVSIAKTDIDAVGNVDITSQTSDIALDKSTIDTAKDVTMTAANHASVQNASAINANKVTIKGGARGQVIDSAITTVDDFNLIADGALAWTRNANINSGKDVNVKANNGYLLLSDSIFNAKNNVNLASKDSVTSVKLAGSEFNAEKDVNVESTQESVLLTSTAQFKPQGLLNLKAAKNVEINSTPDLVTEKMTISAGENVFLTSLEGSTTVKDTTKLLAAKKVFIKGAKDVKTEGVVDLNNIQTNLDAGQDVNVTVANAGNRDNGLIANAGNNMTITTDGILSVSSLIAAKDLTINANKVIAGKPYTEEQKLPGDLVSDRSYIKVGGEFNSNVATDNYEVTESGELSDDGQFNKKHHIQYGSDEKILLVQDRPVDNTITDPTIPGVDNGGDVDVVNPGDVDDDSDVTNPDDGNKPGDGNDDGGNIPGDGNDDGTTPGDGNDDGNKPGDGNDEECPDVPDNDEVVEEDAPELFSTKSFNINANLSNVLKFAASSTSDKK